MKYPFTFEREYHIADLFKINDILDSFHFLEFSSDREFFSFLNRGYLPPIEIDPLKTYNYVVHLSKDSNFQDLDTLLKATDLIEKFTLILHLEKDSFERAFNELNSLNKIKIQISEDDLPYFMDLAELHKSSPLIRHLISEGNHGVIKCVWGAGDYKKKYRDLFNTLLRDLSLFLELNLSFDYVSFEDLKVKDLNELSFYLRQLAVWISPTGNFTFSKPDPDNKTSEASITANFILTTSVYCRKGYLDQNNLYLTKGGEVFLNLDQYWNETGETLLPKDLNRIRRIVDARFSYPGFLNFYLIDLAQNEILSHDPLVVPTITRLIGGWIYNV